MRSRWLQFALGTALGIGIALLVMLAPLSWLGPLFEAARLPIAAILFVCFVGKTLYDTLFFDHYWP